MTEYTGIIRSVYLANERTVWVSPPRELTARKLVVFLDGELYRERVGAPRIVETLLNRREIADTWVVFVSMQSVEARWIECPCHPPFARFMVDELLPWLGAKYPEISLQVDCRVLMGLSYTGLAAGYVAKEAPGLFQRVVCQSGSFWWNDCWLVKAYNQSPAARGTEFYLEVGAREVQENVRHREDVLQVVSQLEGVRRFRDVLLKHGVTVRYSEFEGAHEFPCWSKTLPAALRWALPPTTDAETND